MQIKGIDLAKVTKLISQHVDTVTCLECCKYYLAPERATCGHTLCHNCWKGRRTCPGCAKSLDRRALRVDEPIQALTNHVRDLVEAFEHLFDVKMDELVIDFPIEEKEVDPTKHVKEWLTSSDNHFSAPPYSDTQQSTQDILPPVTISTTKIQVHGGNNRSISPKRVTHVSTPQDDWDKIEVVPDTEEMAEKPKENIVGPMDLEPFFFDDNEYSNEHPRRSSRKRDNKCDEKNALSTKKTNDESSEADKKLDKAKQNWTNVKKMKKEFSKFNKLNKNKLDVSIEMCKKTQSVKSKQNSEGPQNLPVEEVVIDDNTQQDILPIENTVKHTKPFDILEIDRNQKQTAAIPNNDKVIQEDNMERVETSNKHRKDKVVIKDCKNFTDSTKQRLNTDNVTVSECAKESTIKIPFFKKSRFQTPIPPDIPKNDKPETISVTNPDDIHITIRIGDTVANITINKKRDDVQLKVNTDREVQTSLCSNSDPNVDMQQGAKVTKEQGVQTINDTQTSVSMQKSVTAKKAVFDKSISTKKNTASAETATAQFEITESEEKELSKMMECVEDDVNNKIDEIHHTDESCKVTTTVQPNSQTLIKSQQVGRQNDNTGSQNPNKDIPVDLNDMDIFNSGSVKEQNILTLKHTKNTPSEVLPTYRTNKSKTRNLSAKRNINMTHEELPSKRQKVATANEITDATQELNHTTDSPNYDDVMGELFANIDADIQEMQSQKLQSTTKKTVDKKLTQTDKRYNKAQEVDMENEVFEVGKTQTIDKGVVGEKFSENMFSTVGNLLERGNGHVPGPETQQNIENMLTPGTCLELTASKQIQEEVVVWCTPMDDDSDKSVVEETPQKNTSIPKTKSRSDSGNQPVTSLKKYQLTTNPNEQTHKNASDTQDNVINITDSQSVKEQNTESNRVSSVNKRDASETPLTINRFVNNITHNSTPVARKSLRFKNDDIDVDETLCPTDTSSVAKTTQEKQFMSEAFENPKTQVRKPLIDKQVLNKNKSYVIAGSCLTVAELSNIKILCYKRKWTYVDKYAPDITHLVVDVDDKNRAQRSVKYMCALAAGKWIVSMKWVENCSENNTVANEEPYEVLDSTGDPGPYTSRTAQTKIFEGMTFYCMPPFSVLDVDTLVIMLKAAGGNVVKEAKEVRVNDSSPALLLAEPENTSALEDRFIYLAMELGVVPVNYEWALNCLGSYTLCSLHDLLLCPVSLLPKACSSWPEELLASDD